MSRLPKRSAMKRSPMGQGGHLVQMRRPKAIVFDILGTASKSGFLEKILFPFLNTNLDHYITSHWNAKDFIKVYQRIMEHSQELNGQDPGSPVVLAHDNEQAKASLLAFIAYATERSLQLPGVTRLRFMVWFEGYQQSKLRTPIYRDVPDKMKRWFAEGIKFYVFSNTWVEAQKALLRNTNHGDLTNLITDHFDNDFGQLTEPSSWTRLCSQIGQSPTDVLFMTKAPLEGRAAAEAGLSVVLVLTHRHNVRAVTNEDRRHFPYVRTLNDLTWVESQLSKTGNVASSAPGSTGGPSTSGTGAAEAASAAGGTQATIPSSANGSPGSQTVGTGPPSEGTGATSATGGTSGTGATSNTGATSATGATGSRAGSNVGASRQGSQAASGSKTTGPGGSKIGASNVGSQPGGSSATGAPSSQTVAGASSANTSATSGTAPTSHASGAGQRSHSDRNNKSSHTSHK